MLKDVVQVHHIGGYRLQLRFEDDTVGQVDVSSLVTFTGVFAPLEEVAEFAKVRVHPELGTIVWPNGADLDPDVLYALVTGQSIGVTPQHV